MHPRIFSASVRSLKRASVVWVRRSVANSIQAACEPTAKRGRWSVCVCVREPRTKLEMNEKIVAKTINIHFKVNS